MSLFIDRNATVYFDAFGIEYILEDVLNKIEDKIHHSQHIWTCSLKKASSVTFQNLLKIDYCR